MKEKPLTSPELTEIDDIAAQARAHLKLAASAYPSAPEDEATALGNALGDAFACVDELARLAAEAETGRVEAQEQLRAMRIRAGGLS